MDGLSAAASAIAVVSLAVQIAESLRELCDFWDSIQEAPEDIRAILNDLRLLELVIGDIRRSGEVHSADAVTSLALESCSQKVFSLVVVVNDIEPGFRAASRRKRGWSSFKAALKGGKLKRFRDSLSETKLTLLLARQGSSDRIIRSLFESQQHSLAMSTESQQRTVGSTAESLKQLSTNSVSRTVRTSSGTLQSVREDHLADLQVDAQVIASAVPIPRLRPKVTEAFSEALHNSTTLSDIDPRSTPHPETVDCDRGKPSRRLPGCHRKTVKFHCRGHYRSASYSLSRRPFGYICVGSRTWRECTVGDDNINSRAVEAPFHAETTFTLFPALWLIRLGMKTGLDVMIYTSSLGWKKSLTIKPFRAVPGDSLIFDFCRNGDVDGIKTLFSRGEATVWDRDSHGWTPLHYAGLSFQSRACKLLLDSGADLTALSNYGNSPVNFASEARFGGNRNVYVNKIDTLRLLIDRIEFDDYVSSETPFCSPYLSLLASIISVEEYYRSALSPREFPVSQWLVSTYCLEIKEEVDDESLVKLCKIAQNPYFIEHFCNIIDNASDLYNEEHDFALIKSMVKHMDPHRYSHQVASSMISDLIYVFRKGISRHISLGGKTITSVALKNPKRFAVWNAVLQELQVEIDQFIEEEFEGNSWIARHWTRSTLRNLFETWNRTSSINSGVENCACSGCPYGDKFSWSFIRWDIVLAKAKEGRVVATWDTNPSLCGICCLCSPLTSWTVREENDLDKNYLDEDDSNENDLDEGSSYGADHESEWSTEDCQCSDYRHLEGYPQTCEGCRSPSIDADAQLRELPIPGAFEPIYI